MGCWSRGAHAAIGFIILVGCNGGGAADDARYALAARAGIYEDGSGRSGIALVATLRDRSGSGPDAPWTLTLRGAGGSSLGSATYHAAGPGSYAVFWWPDVAPHPDLYELNATSGDETVRTAVSIDEGGGIAPPEPRLVSGASTIEWPALFGAAAYSCRAYASGSIQLESTGAETTCDVSALPPGAYVGSVIALSTDPSALMSDDSRIPALPARFDVSERTLGFVRTDGTQAPVVMRAAGGAYDDGVGARSLAVWLSIANADGTPTAQHWMIEVSGPGVAAGAPIGITYWASFPRLMAWIPGLPATPGTYTITAQSATQLATAQLTVGAPAWLDMPFGLSVSDGAQGSAS